MRTHLSMIQKRYKQFRHQQLKRFETYQITNCQNRYIFNDSFRRKTDKSASRKSIGGAEANRSAVYAAQQTTNREIIPKSEKLKQPAWNEIDLQEHTYIGWNDPGTQKKFMVYYEDEKLKGISGTLSPTINKGICAICQKTSNVSLFLSTTKAGSDGTYTKKGNYICHDSDQCNQQLTKLAPFYEFAERVKKER